MKINKQFVFSVFVGFMMITWAVGIALSSQIHTKTNSFSVSNFYDQLLTAKEKVAILRSGKVLIEYLYLFGPDAEQKKADYQAFASRFKDLVVVEAVAVSSGNQTLDQMIVPTGDVIPLDNVSSSDLIDVFCKNSYVQPKECLLREI
ncbi:MAG: hypothetical protein J7K54_01755 [Candidatus Aenigmarchaeota archaeon]|nr:hypothetical protein [Candidatus Aenigmarchaeota archaeon]